MLKATGFSQVRRMSFGRTVIPGLCLGGGVRSLFDRVYEREGRAHYSLFVDAIK
jgi:hypothetical protein